MASSARIDELRKKFDENPRRYFAPLANEFRKAGDLEQAVFICQEYLPQQPGHMSGHIVYGQALFELGRDEEAKAVFETALSLDPENLIALRHLGDIARQAGDLDVARFWYQRVLESDPRNDEIAQILMTLEASRGEDAAHAAESVSPPPIEPPSIPEPAQATATEISPAPSAASAEPNEAIIEPVESVHANANEAAAEPESFEPFEGYDRTIDFDQNESGSVSEPIGAATSESVSEPEPRVAAPLVSEEAAVGGADEHPVHAGASDADTDELLDIGEFSIGGEQIDVDPEAMAASPETTSRASDVPTIDFGDSAGTTDAVAPIETPSASAEFVPDTSDAPASGPSDSIYDSDEAGWSFEPQPPAAEPEPPVMSEAQPEPDIELATDINLGLPPDEPVAQTEFRPEPEVAAHAIEASAIESAETHGVSDSAGEPPAQATDEVFVTETMANLYVEQGHLADALEIYEKLLAHNPGDAKIEARVRDIKERIYGRSRDAVWEPAQVAGQVASTARPAQPGPTIREFLRAAIARRTQVEPSTHEEAPATPTPTAPVPAASETVTGSIDALFLNAAPNDGDRSAASALAQAFGEWPEPTPIGGVPAHEASSELSLDHVFKANAVAPRREDADAFSFDQFFSEDMGEGAAGAENAAGQGPAEGVEDIAQFNAWLNGLKKT